MRRGERDRRISQVTPREAEQGTASAPTFRNYEDSKFQDRVERTWPRDPFGPGKICSESRQ